METGKIMLSFLAGIFIMLTATLSNANGKSNYISYTIFTDSGDFTPNSETYVARLGRLKLNTDTLRILLEQIRENPKENNPAIIASTSLVYNLYLAGSDPLSTERVTWWMNHGPKNIKKRDGKIKIPEFSSLQETKQALEDAGASIKEAAQELLEKLPNHFTLYVNPTGDFVVLLLKNVNPATVGFLPTKLTKIAWEQAAVELEKRVPFITTLTPPSINNLSAIIDLKNQVPKHVLLRGHGHFNFSKIERKDSHQVEEGALYARLDRKEFQKLLNLLNSINVLTLYVWTCFAGGTTIPEMFKTIVDAQGKLEFDFHSIKFIVFMGATGENMILGTLSTPENTPDLRAYFEEINLFMRDTDPEKLKKVLKPLRLESYQASNTPSVRFVGNELFRITTLNEKATMFNETKQTGILLQHRLNYGDKTDIPLPPYQIKTNNFWYYYPFHIQIPLALDGTLNYENWSDTLPELVAMTQGKTTYLFDSISATEAPFPALIRTIAGRISTEPRLHLIKKLICAADPKPTPEQKEKKYDYQKQLPKRTIEGLVIHVKPAQTNVGQSATETDAAILTLYYKDPVRKQYLEGIDPKTSKPIVYTKPTRVTIVGDLFDTRSLAAITWREISAADYSKKTKDFIQATLPTREVIVQSSGGKTTPEMVKENAEKFVDEIIRGVPEA